MPAHPCRCVILLAVLPGLCVNKVFYNRQDKTIAPLVSESGWTLLWILEQRYPRMSKFELFWYWKGQDYVILIASSTVSTFIQHSSRYEPICNLYLGYKASSSSYLSGRRTVYSNQALFSILEYLKLCICLILDETPSSKSNARNKATHTLPNVFRQGN